MRAAEIRLRNGDVAAAEVARIHVDALRAQNDARQAEAERIRAQSGLAYMLGAEAVANRLRVTDGWRESADSLSGAEAKLDELIERRPDVRAAKARVGAAQANRDLARSLRTRDVSVGVQYERFPPDSPNTYGFGVSVPLFLNHGFEGEIRRAEVDLYSAQDDLERTRALARGEAQRTLSDARASQERVERYRGTLMAEAKRAADAAEFAYKNGAIGVMDLLDSRRVLRAIQIDAATAQAEYSKALAAWEIAAGAAH
jgi:cobalt-zinc-cadmium efflux system outer membrane protein